MPVVGCARLQTGLDRIPRDFQILDAGLGSRQVALIKDGGDIGAIPWNADRSPSLEAVLPCVGGAVWGRCGRCCTRVALIGGFDSAIPETLLSQPVGLLVGNLFMVFSCRSEVIRHQSEQADLART